MVTWSDSIAGTCPQIITRTWTCTDACGNASSCDQIITVVDTTPPEIICPDDVTLDTCGEDCVSDTVATAKFWAAEGGSFVSYACQHLHGGIGIDVDYPMHRDWLWSSQNEHMLGAAAAQLADMGLLKCHVGVDCIPIGDQFKMGPDDADPAVELIDPGVVIPMHYNTFDLIAQDPEAFASKVGNRARVVILNPGDSYDF